MNSERINKINQLIKQNLGQLITKEVELPKDCLVTITRVKTASDMKISKIYISVIPEKLRGTVLENLRKNKKKLHNLLKKQIKTKFTPNLKFEIDQQEIFASEIDKLLDEIK